MVSLIQSRAGLRRVAVIRLEEFIEVFRGTGEVQSETRNELRFIGTGIS